jgi:hypothetical protein
MIKKPILGKREKQDMFHRNTSQREKSVKAKNQQTKCKRPRVQKPV